MGNILLWELCVFLELSFRLPSDHSNIGWNKHTQIHTHGSFIPLPLCHRVNSETIDYSGRGTPTIQSTEKHLVIPRVGISEVFHNPSSRCNFQSVSISTAHLINVFTNTTNKREYVLSQIPKPSLYLTTQRLNAILMF